MQVVKENDSDKIKAKLNQFENLWIRQLITAYPYGLNNKIKGYGMATEIADPTIVKSAPYFDNPTCRRNRGHGVRKRSCKKVHDLLHQELMQISKEQYTAYELKAVVVFLRKQAKNTLSKCLAMINSQNILVSSTLRLLILAFLAGFYKVRQKTMWTAQPYRLVVYFPNKGMESIQMQSIFRDRELKNLFESEKKSEVKPVTVVYTYEPPLSLDLFNYSKSLTYLANSGLRGLQKISCNCRSSKFIYDPVGHVITGNLDIVSNCKLKSLFSYGAKYRLPEFLNWEAVLEAAKQAIAVYYQYIVTKKLISVQNAEKYVERFLHIVKSRICLAQQNSIEDKPIISRYAIKYALKDLHKKYVVIPADKAANNFVFVCKYWYVNIISKEMGINFENGQFVIHGNETYKPSTVTLLQIIDKHISLNSMYNITTIEQNKQLPKIFATPKLHKDPFGWRFIAGASKASIKQVSILLYRILAFFKKHFANYCTALYRNMGKNCYWSVENSLQVKNKLLAFGIQKQIFSLVTCDFATLFKTLPHNCILKSLFQLVDICFRNSGKQYLEVNSQFLKYCDEMSIVKATYINAIQAKELIATVVDQTYVQYAGQIFHQECGVSMGSNASPVIADLTLTVMEYEFVRKNQSIVIPLACRYIDDIIVINVPNFEQIAVEIYGLHLPLKQTNATLDKANFLDLHIEIHSNICKFKIYNKTDDFDFTVVRFPFKASNVHSQIGYNTFYSQLIRVGRLTEDSTDFENRTREMFMELLKHGFERYKLIKKFLQFSEKYSSLLLKFGICYHGDVLRFMNRALLN